MESPLEQSQSFRPCGLVGSVLANQALDLLGDKTTNRQGTLGSEDPRLADRLRVELNRQVALLGQTVSTEKCTPRILRGEASADNYNPYGLAAFVPMSTRTLFVSR